MVRGCPVVDRLAQGWVEPDGERVGRSLAHRWATGPPAELRHVQPSLCVRRHPIEDVRREFNASPLQSSDPEATEALARSNENP